VLKYLTASARILPCGRVLALMNLGLRILAARNML
jgi:hypothetical protein